MAGGIADNIAELRSLNLHSYFSQYEDSFYSSGAGSETEFIRGELYAIKEIYRYLEAAKRSTTDKTLIKVIARNGESYGAEGDVSLSLGGEFLDARIKDIVKFLQTFAWPKDADGQIDESLTRIASKEVLRKNLCRIFWELDGFREKCENDPQLSLEDAKFRRAALHRLGYSYTEYRNNFERFMEESKVSKADFLDKEWYILKLFEAIPPTTNQDIASIQHLPLTRIEKKIAGSQISSADYEVLSKLAFLKRPIYSTQTNMDELSTLRQENESLKNQIADLTHSDPLAIKKLRHKLVLLYALGMLEPLKKIKENQTLTDIQVARVIKAILDDESYNIDTIRRDFNDLYGDDPERVLTEGAKKKVSQDLIKAGILPNKLPAF